MTPAAIAANRFGIGMRGDAPPIGRPKAWLTEQLAAFEPRPAPLTGLATRADVAAALAQYATIKRERKPMLPADDQGKRGPGTVDQGPDIKQARQAVRDIYLACVGARVNAALVTPAPFVERMVHFWANHFAVSIDKPAVVGFAGLLEFDAIRPHVLGRFADMLQAVERHPAMLLYLDQVQSVGPDSEVASRRAARGGKRTGLNENLAREILELHTLGVRSGYSQSDVTEFARVLTGWTVGGLTAERPDQRFARTDAPGEAVFREQQHQPGTSTILGRRYAQTGAAQSQAVLADLARHPATANHIAVKLARQFAGDTPSPALVTRLARVFMAGDGDLPQLYRALIEAPECWTETPAKFKSPWDWSLSALRAIDLKTVEPQALAGMLIELGQPVWKPGSPAGFDDLDAGWAAPDALVRRIEAGQRIAARAGAGIDARSLADGVLAGSLSASTRQTLAQADSGAQALALLFAAPEFMRR